jgi:hypothetical protein
MEKEKNTVLQYMYRDADNYKTNSKRFVFEGQLSKSQIAQIVEKYGEGCDGGFIPSQIGLMDLQSQLQGYDSVNYDVDHCWHEVIELATTSEPVNQIMTADGFFKRILGANWNEFKVSHPLDK